jgi:hypothetical protein
MYTWFVGNSNTTISNCTTRAPGPLPESQFIASCRDELPPPRPPTKTLGLKKKNKQQVSKKKENQVPDV